MFWGKRSASESHNRSWHSGPVQTGWSADPPRASKTTPFAENGCCLHRMSCSIFSQWEPEKGSLRHGETLTRDGAQMFKTRILSGQGNSSTKKRRHQLTQNNKTAPCTEIEKCRHRARRGPQGGSLTYSPKITDKRKEASLRIFNIGKQRHR